MKAGIILSKPYCLSNTLSKILHYSDYLDCGGNPNHLDHLDLVNAGGNHPEETFPATNKQQQEEQFEEEDRQVIIIMTYHCGDY